MIVVDASALIDVLAGEGRPARRLADEHLAAPHLLDAEVASVLRRQTQHGLLDPGVAAGALDDLRQAAITRYRHVDLLDRVWELREDLSAYDALYVALAEKLGAPLVTMDAKIATTPGLRASIEVIAH